MLAQLSPVRLQAEETDLVLADLGDDCPDQEIFLTRLRAAATLLPVIVIAPYGQELIRTRPDNLSGCHLLTSPLDPEELYHCLAQATARDKANDRQSSHNAYL